MRESVDSTIAIFMRFSKRRRRTEPNHPLCLRICAAMKCLSVTISPHRFGRCYLPQLSTKRFSYRNLLYARLGVGDHWRNQIALTTWSSWVGFWADDEQLLPNPVRKGCRQPTKCSLTSCGQ